MFTLGSSENFEWPVRVSLPVSGGKHQEVSFKAAFKRLPQSRCKELLLLGRTGEISDNDVVKEVLTGWSDVVDNDSRELPFNPANLDRLLEVPTAGACIVAAYFEAVGGGKRKN